MDLQAGLRIRTHLEFTQEQFDAFASISGDDNPIHVDPEFAARTRFERTLAHGMFLFGTSLAGLPRTRLGRSARVVAQSLRFPGPTFAGDKARLVVEVVEATTTTARLRTVIDKADGTTCCEGETWLASGGAAPVLPPPSSGETAEAMGRFEVGQRAEKHRVFTRGDVAAYATLTRDTSALADSAVPEALIGGLFSDLLGTELPGRGTNWMKQSFEFVRPVQIDEVMTASVEIVRLRPEKQLVNLMTIARDTDGAVVCRGNALVMAREMAS
ncbi:MAG: MaoC/PaaZ C-terminal domain-containing protein [Deltaproteobacteria bacterium]